MFDAFDPTQWGQVYWQRQNMYMYLAVRFIWSKLGYFILNI